MIGYCVVDTSSKNTNFVSNSNIDQPSTRTVFDKSNNHKSKVENNNNYSHGRQGVSKPREKSELTNLFSDDHFELQGETENSFNSSARIIQLEKQFTNTENQRSESKNENIPIDQYYHRSQTTEILRPLLESETFAAQYIPLTDERSGNFIQIRDIISYIKEHSDGQSFYVIDLSHIIRQVERWYRNLPRVRLHYAVKCNPNPNILRLLHLLGCGFDCASLKEIEAVEKICRENVYQIKHQHNLNEECQDFLTNLKFNPKYDIIFANPTKQLSHISYAYKHHVKWTTVDSTTEIDKLAKNWPDAKALIRITTNDQYSICQFSSKFGCTKQSAKDILARAQHKDVQICGVSFHVGSGCSNPKVYEEALKDAKDLFDIAQDEFGFHFDILDIGGGFSGCIASNPSFEDFAWTINQALDKYFPHSAYPDLHIIAEPGRFIADASHSIACSIFSKKDKRSEKKHSIGARESLNSESYHEKSEMIHKSEDTKLVDDFHYWISDGVYGSFNNIIFDHYEPYFEYLKQVDANTPKYRTTLWGPTCDSIDCLSENCHLPELELGDWIFVRNMGAYTTSASSGFNGFPTPDFFYIYRN